MTAASTVAMSMSVMQKSPAKNRFEIPSHAAEGRQFSLPGSLRNSRASLLAVYTVLVQSMSADSPHRVPASNPGRYSPSCSIIAKPSSSGLVNGSPSGSEAATHKTVFAPRCGSRRSSGGFLVHTWEMSVKLSE
jgi:hypothetical protein